MTAWGWWLVASGLLAALEVATLTLVFGMLSLASLVGLIVERSGGNPATQILIALASSVPLLLLARPFAQKYFFRNSPNLKTGIEGYIGRIAKVTMPIAPGAPGQVSVHGELWPATSSMQIDANASVVIDAVAGPNLVVSSQAK